MNKILKVLIIGLFTLFVGYNMLSAAEIEKEIYHQKFESGNEAVYYLYYDTDNKGKEINEDLLDEIIFEYKIDTYKNQEVEVSWTEIEEIDYDFNTESFVTASQFAADLYAYSRLEIRFADDNTLSSFIEFYKVYSKEDEQYYICNVYVY